ncbi:hypothetical protein M6I34_13455 [Burkholderiaceae bacterium FT117]|uniref:lipopolysaccharide biosynthesis protein n=1 Tax=Zeimonas sediminis TaxID=2944268 RepID=UPI002342D83D|nr:hypothetical protein [Zeimonas sediminis]MCM5571521.1 hypothetical protein [Zeimonas sediminis]
MTRTDPYSGSRIARGVIHLLGGKALVSVAGIGTFLVLVQALPVEQFAAYTVLFALVELVDALSGVGVPHVLARYVPELYAAHRRRTVRHLVVVALALRGALLFAFAGVAYLLVPVVAPMVGLTGWEPAFRLYLVVVVLRVFAQAVFGVLESMLHQSLAQLGAGSVTLSRFVLLWGAAAQAKLDLHLVILIELATEAVGVLLLCGGLARTLSLRADDGGEDGAGWVRANLRRMLDFGFKGYLQHLLIMPFGGAVQRLIVGASLSTADVALFGFARSVADLARRYLPATMLAGVIRPVLTARYVSDRRFEDLVRAANLVFKVNAIGICLGIVVLHAGGRGLVDAVTSAKYGEGAVILLLLMLAVLLVSSLRLMLDHVSHAVERNGPLVVSNAVITLSILPGIAILPVAGVYALPLSNLLGLGFGCFVLVRWLRAGGFDYRYDAAGAGKMLLASAGGMAAGQVSTALQANWMLSVACAVLGFAVVAFASRPFDTADRALMAAMFRRR